MKIYYAPLEGVTDSVYRRVHHECYGGISKYFIPFVSPTQHMVFTPRELNAISPQQNKGMPAVPQILTKNAEHFLWAAGQMQEMGYAEVNLNLGCPSATVTGKGKGSGMLRDLDALRSFLDEIFVHSPIPVSLKTRIGYTFAEEWSDLLTVFRTYPCSELIIHPRTRNEFYTGDVHRDCFSEAVQNVSVPLVYNGDLFSVNDCIHLMKQFPSCSALMIGRGLLANPALAQQLHGGEGLSLSSIRHFHQRLYESYMECWPKNVVLMRMNALINYIACCFEDPRKQLKNIHKAKTHEAYLDAVAQLFDTHPLREAPFYERLEKS